MLNQICVHESIQHTSVCQYAVSSEFRTIAACGLKCVCMWVIRTSLVHQHGWHPALLTDALKHSWTLARSVHHFLSVNNKIRETAPSDYVFKGNWANQPRLLRHNWSRRRWLASALRSSVQLTHLICFILPWFFSPLFWCSSSPRRWPMCKCSSSLAEQIKMRWQTKGQVVLNSTT